MIWRLRVEPCRAAKEYAVEDTILSINPKKPQSQSHTRDILFMRQKRDAARLSEENPMPWSEERKRKKECMIYEERVDAFI